MTRQGFDFTTDSNSNASAGPELGAKLDLASLKGRDGISLASVSHAAWIMLVTIDPQCGACSVASDEMRDVHQQVQSSGVDYYPVSFTACVTAATSSSDYFAYADSLQLNAPAFLWANAKQPSPDKLLMMVLPSHILVDANGTIVRKWPGTDRSPRVRQQMANQIVADTLEELNHRTSAK